MTVSGILADDVSWESVFYFFGLLGVLWFIFWAFLCFDSPAKHPRISSVRYLKKQFFRAQQRRKL
jgi:MFS family permease